MVTQAVSMISSEFPGAMPVFSCRHGYIPVRSPKREGVLVAEVGIGVGELYTLSGKAVDMGSTDLCRSIAAKVAYAKVVREYINNVRLL